MGAAITGAHVMEPAHESEAARGVTPPQPAPTSGAMPVTALLAAAPGIPLEPPLTVVGRSTLERQVRQVRLAGVARVITLGEPYPDTEATSAAGLASRVSDEDLVLVMTPGLVVDERIISAVVAAAPALATWPGDRHGVERIDASTVFAGVAVYPGRLVRKIAAGLGDWDLHSTLLRMALQDRGIGRIDLSVISLYAPKRRRSAPLIWALPTSQDEAAASTGPRASCTRRSRTRWCGCSRQRRSLRIWSRCSSPR